MAAFSSEDDRGFSVMNFSISDDRNRLDAHTVVNLSLRCQLFRTVAASNCFLFLGRRCEARRTDRSNDFLAIRRSR